MKSGEDQSPEAGSQNEPKSILKSDKRLVTGQAKKKGVRFFEGVEDTASDSSVATEESKSVSSQPPTLKGVTETKSQDEYQNFLAGYLSKFREKR